MEAHMVHPLMNNVLLLPKL